MSRSSSRPSTTTAGFRAQQDPFGSGTYGNVSLTGTDDSYDILKYQFAYCTGVGAPMTALNLFYECYTSCSNATLLTPTMALQITGLPGAPTPGVSPGCWVVDIDLLGATLNFTMQGDCDGSWDGSAAMDYMGYAYMQVTPDPAGISGPFIAGDPDGLLAGVAGGTGCCVGCGTVFWAGTNVPGVNNRGSGLNDQDFFEVDDHLGGYAFSYNGCFWFGGYSANTARADLYMEIQGYGSTPCRPGVQYCDGKTASGNPCPCNNDNAGISGPFAGCANSHTAGGAVLDATGNASLSGDTVVFMVTGMEPNNSLMFFQTLNNLDGAGSFLGDGIRCAGGNLKRLKVKLADANGHADSSPTVISVRSAQLGDTITPGSVRRYQVWGRDTLNPACGLGVNDSTTSNGYEIVWQP